MPSRCASPQAEAVSAEQSEPAWPGDVPFVLGLALAVRAGRRELRLSQRAFAERTGLSKSSVARLEAARPGCTLETMGAALAGVGLRLALADGDGAPWSPVTGALEVDQLDARDEAGRRFPAHLEPVMHTFEPTWRLLRRVNRDPRGRRPQDGYVLDRLGFERPGFERPGTSRGRGLEDELRP
jgi:transcriptional regulator with XRE-family HTH domain